MKKNTSVMIAVVLFMISYKAFSQTFVVDTILYNGDKSKLLNIVIIGDGFMAGEQSLFKFYATNVKEHFFSQPPFSNYVNYFNVFAIEVPSNESGANHPGTSPDPDCPPVPVSTADNYFGSTFDAYGIHRLVCIRHYDSAANVLAANFPEYDIVLFMANSPYYGGSGGYYSVTTINPASDEVTIHEIGHSFGDLADEYWSGSPWEAPNQTMNSSPSTIRWKNWLYDNGIGIYPFTENSSWYRPHQGCKMQYLYVPFCSVCAERLIETIHNLVNPVNSYYPSDLLAITADTALLDFRLDLLCPVPNTLKTEWTIDGHLAAVNTASFQVDPDTLALGGHQLAATVMDTTVLTRSDDHWISHMYNVTWDINVFTTGINLNSHAASAGIQVYPNPFREKLKIDYRLDADSKVAIDIIDASGKLIKTMVDKYQSPGNYELSLFSSEIENADSPLFIKFSFNNHVIIRPIVHVE
jgi:hypothetical protein